MVLKHYYEPFILAANRKKAIILLRRILKHVVYSWSLSYI